MMEKNTWLKNILTMVQEISDKEYQEKVWLNGEGDEMSSFTEVICGLFDDYDFEGFIRKYSSENYLDEPKMKMLILLRDKLNQYLLIRDEELPTDELLNDPEWHKIQLLASETMDIFNN